MTTRAHPCETRVPWQHVFPQRRPVILRLKEFAVDYFWTEAGSFGKQRPGHFEDLTSSSHCLPTALGAAQAPAAHIFTHHLMKLYVKDSSTMRPLRRNTQTESVEIVHISTSHFEIYIQRLNSESRVKNEEKWSAACPKHC